MKKLMVMIALLMSGCTKTECMHMHVNGAMLEICSKNVQCVKSKEGSDTLKICGYVPPEAEEEK